MEAKANPDEQCCPSCGGTSGCEYTVTEIHDVQADWAKQGMLNMYVHEGGSRFSLVRCRDCGMRFNFDALRRKGLLN